MKRLAAAFVLVVWPAIAAAQVDPAVLSRARQEAQPLLATLKELVEIESGSSDVEGVTRIGRLIGDKLRRLGGAVEFVPPAANFTRLSTTPPRIADTVVGRFRGRGTARILLLAHMDTVYQRGMLAEQPFRVEAGRAYGLGIADDKQGIAVILHALAVLRTVGYDRYGLITVLISPDEEVGSVAERDLITSLGAEHDLVLSFEGAGVDDNIRLATSGVRMAILSVKGRASHAGAAPDQGRNALYELAHQLLQMRDLSNPARAVKMNWTVSSAGTVPNVIPADASAIGDMRADDVKDFDGVEATIRERIQTHLIPDTTVSVRFEDLYPPMKATAASVSVAEHARRLYAEAGGTLKVNQVSVGGGTDAAFAALRTTAPVLEGLGLRTFGAHSGSAEYVETASIEPRLYLVARLIMDVGDGKVTLPAGGQTPAGR